MKDDQFSAEKHNLPIMTGQSALAQTAWTMTSPSIVLTFLAVALGMPVFLIGALVSVRQAASSLVDVFLFDPISQIKNRKRALALSDLALASCFALAIIATLYATKSVTMVIFVISVFGMGIISEFQNLLLTNFIGDNLKSKSRRTMTYAQMAFGGGFAVVLTWIAHEVTLDLPPLHRHSIVISIGIICFVLAAFLTFAVRDLGESQVSANQAIRSPLAALSTYFSNVARMLKQPWFRKYIALRATFVTVVQSLPFFAIISAEAHHTSEKGLTAMIISYAMGYIVAGPLWGVLNNVSHRLVMVLSALMVALSGIALVASKMLDLNPSLHVHAIALFVVTIAVTGLSTVRGLYFLDIAPKDQRVRGAAVAQSMGRVSAIILSILLAGVAHMQETVWAIAFITLASLLSAVVSFNLVRPEKKTN